MNEQQHEQEPARRGALSFIGWTQVVGAIVILIIIGILLHFAWPYLAWFGPVFGYVLGGTVIVCIPALPLAIGWRMWQENKRKNFRDHLVRPTAENAYSAFFDEKKGKFVQADPIAPPLKVPQTYSPQIRNDVREIARYQELMRGITTVEAVEDKPLQITGPREDESITLIDGQRQHADTVLSRKKLIVGMTGSGKSNSVGALEEELGHLDVPSVLADTENEYESLCDPRWLPHGVLAGANYGTYNISVENAFNFGRYVLDHNLQVILNLQSYDEMEEAALVMVNIIQGLRDWEEERPNEVRIPCEFLLEEATTWLPQNVRESPLYGTEALQQLQNAFFNSMVRKGRKRGLGLTVVCHNLAEIDKRALQVEWKLLHRQAELPDLERYAKMGITADEALSLRNGEAFLFSASASKLRVQVRRRYSHHGADTPGLKNLQQYQQALRNGTADIRSFDMEAFAKPTEALTLPPLPTREEEEPSLLPLRPMQQQKRRATISDAIAVWNSEQDENMGSPRLRELLQQQGLECSDYLSRQLLDTIRGQLRDEQA